MTYIPKKTPSPPPSEEDWVVFDWVVFHWVVWVVFHWVVSHWVVFGWCLTGWCLTGWCLTGWCFLTFFPRLLQNLQRWSPAGWLVTLRCILGNGGEWMRGLMSSLIPTVVHSAFKSLHHIRVQPTARPDWSMCKNAKFVIYIYIFFYNIIQNIYYYNE